MYNWIDGIERLGILKESWDWEERLWVFFVYVVEVFWNIKVKMLSKSLVVREEFGLGRWDFELVYIIRGRVWLKWFEKRG